MQGYVHSIETLGALDGPGLRVVVFMQGCPLRCRYCHNPDTWPMAGGTEYAPTQLIAKIKRYKPYFLHGGGVTVSGGEPLLQQEFVKEFFKLSQKEGIHTALDTSGFKLDDGTKELLEYTDLVILDVKHSSSASFYELTGHKMQGLLNFLAYCKKKQQPLWLRQVLVPGLTDSEEQIKDLAQLMRGANLTKAELLPYHTLGVKKWQALGYDYTLEDVQPPSAAELAKWQQLLEIYLKENLK